MEAPDAKSSSAALPAVAPGAPAAGPAPGSLAARKFGGRIAPTLKVGPAAAQTAKVNKLEDRRIRVIGETELIEDFYDFKDKLQDSGQQGVVYDALCRKSNLEVIVKMRARKFAVGGESVWRSLLERMLNLDNHSHVLGLRDVLEDQNYYYIVMERCSGGELFDFLQTETDVPERECKRIMREILQAVDHIHQQGLIHRDIKPENIMFHDTDASPAKPKETKDGSNRSPVSNRSPGTIKLIDFDTCQELEAQSRSPKPSHVVGTMGYIAPEALRGDYTPASDLWSVGVILYILMTGDMPFSSDLFGEEGLDDTRCGSKSMEALYEKLKDAEIDFECDPWPSFPQARDLCERLLAFTPEARSPSALHALNHPWLSS